jgi:hypothetical protein
VAGTAHWNSTQRRNGAKAQSEGTEYSLPPEGGVPVRFGTPRLRGSNAQIGFEKSLRLGVLALKVVRIVPA